MDESKKWYQKSPAIILLLVLFFPAGLYLMWKYAKWNKVVKIVITGVLALVVFTKIGGSSNNSNLSSPQKTSPTQDQQKTENKDVTPKVGDVTRLGDREFIVNSAKRSQGFGYNTPKTGKEFVIVSVTISNLGSDEVSYNPFDFKVQDANGAQESAVAASYSTDNPLNSGTLAPKGKVTGTIVFEVPKGDQATLIFQPSFWSSQRVLVDLGTK